MKIAAGTSRGVTTDLPDAAKPDHLTAALRRHGVLLAGRAREVTTEEPRDTLVSRTARLKLTFEGAAEKTPTSVTSLTSERDLASLDGPALRALWPAGS